MTTPDQWRAIASNIMKMQGYEHLKVQAEVWCNMDQRSFVIKGTRLYLPISMAHSSVISVTDVINELNDYLDNHCKTLRLKSRCKFGTVDVEIPYNQWVEIFQKESAIFFQGSSQGSGSWVWLWAALIVLCVSALVYYLELWREFV